MAKPVLSEDQIQRISQIVAVVSECKPEEIEAAVALLPTETQRVLKEALKLRDKAVHLAEKGR